MTCGEYEIYCQPMLHIELNNSEQKTSTKPHQQISKNLLKSKKVSTPLTTQRQIKQ